MRFLLPTGIGDSVWALHKIQSIRNKLDPHGPIDVSLVGGNNQLDSRALDFVRRFPFVDSADMKAYAIHKTEWPYHPSGCYDYIDDGLYEFDGDKYCVLVPNAALERGNRLEQWLPQYAIDWSIFDRFRIDENEHAFGRKLREDLGDYAVFYLGPLHGNTQDGHNRGPLWTPAEWVELGRRVNQAFGLQIVVVGAPYDATYYSGLVRPLLNGACGHWNNLIGYTNLGQLWSITLRAKFVISYQAGVGIVSTYLGTPTAIFWRPRGDSISSSAYLSFNERMASAWVPPKMIDDGRHLPLIYRRHGVDYIVSEIERRRWAAPSTCASVAR